MKKNSNLFHRIVIPLVFVFLGMVGVGLRLYKIDQPVADWHSFRQADTASVAQLFYQNGIDLLRPRYHDLSNIQSGKDNPQGWRMVEFPVYQAAAVLLKGAIPSVPLDMCLRILTIMSFVGTGLLLGIWIIRRASVLWGVITTALYMILPYGMFYGRTILPDPTMVFFAIASLVVLDFAFDRRSLFGSGIVFLVSALCACLSLLVKPVAVFMLLPALVLFWEGKKSWKIKIPVAFMWGLIALLPFLGWREWITQFPEGIPAFDWLLNGNNIRFKGAWFYWLFAQRIGNLMFGYWGLILVGLGFVLPARKSERVFWALGIGSLLYLIIVAGGNVQHDYYQILLLPFLSIIAGKGLSNLLFATTVSWSQRVSRIGVGVVSVVFLCMFSWYTMRTYYWINRPEIIEVGKLADQLLPKNAKVIAPYNGDTTFLYQTKRTGWPLGFDIQKKIRMGATHYVTVSPTDNDLETRDLARDYTVMIRTDKYAIIDLTKPRKMQN